MLAPIPFALYQRLQRLLFVTATAWGLTNAQQPYRMLGHTDRTGPPAKITG